MALSNLIPLFILVTVVGFLGVASLVVYHIVQEVSTKAKETMEKKHVMFTGSGVQVGVQELGDEDYKDRSQRYVYLFSPLFVIIISTTSALSTPLRSLP
jgi:hypothetical protein